MWCDLNEAFGEGNNTFKKDWKQVMTNDDKSTKSKMRINIKDDMDTYKSDISNDSLNGTEYYNPNINVNNKKLPHGFNSLDNEFITDNHNYNKYSKIDNFANVSIQNSIVPLDEDNIKSNMIFQSNPYFSAQGDLYNQNSDITCFSSSKVPSSPLQNDNNEMIDKNNEKKIKRVQFDDNLNKISKEENKIKIYDSNHEYYINTFLNILLRNDSKSTETNSDVYDHIKNCKFCREKIKNTLISYQNNTPYKNINDVTINNNQENINNLNGYNSMEQEMYNSNGIELMILIIMGVIIMLIVDMIFKME